MRDKLSETLLLMSLSALHPLQPAAKQLRQMTTAGIIETLWRALDSSSRKFLQAPHLLLLSVGLLRHLLTRAGGPADRLQERMLDLQRSESEILSTVGALMTRGGATILSQPRVVAPALTQQLSQSRVFSGVKVDLGYVNNLILSLNLILSPLELVSRRKYLI